LHYRTGLVLAEQTVNHRKPHNATTLTHFERKLEKLIREKEDLDQMREDMRYAHRFRKMIVHEQND